MSDPVLDTAGGTKETARETADVTVEVLAAPIQSVAAAANAATDAVLRTFVPATAPDGSLVAANTVLALVSEDEIATLRAGGYEVLAERPMPGLGRSLLTLRLAAGADAAATLRVLRKNLAGATVDYNHLYRWDGPEAADGVDGANNAAGADAAPASAAPVSGALPAGNEDRLRIGVIDSAVQAEHRSLAGVDIRSADFVTHDAERLQTHGTAIASLIVRSADRPVQIVSAGVFFQVPGYAPGASAESLVTALDWLATEKVDVINMSLSGPGNDLLDAAVAAVQAHGLVVVAAVGNAGPSSPPLYPAAYEGVIGVTAVDRKNRVFRVANRGDYVDFAALGVDVKVADCTTGGYRIESGTSMASPHVAVVAAELLHARGLDPEALGSWLIAGARDLGRKGFDPVYGYGLVTRPPVVAAAGPEIPTRR
jgi:subtilisin family serine protease